MSGSKRCRECGEEKDASQFVMPHGRPSNICRVCYAEQQLGISPPRTDSPKIRTRHGEASGDTYELWQDLTWKRRIAEASRAESLAERVWEEGRRERQKVLQRAKWKARWALAKYIARVVAHHVDQMVRQLERLPGVRVLVGVVGLAAGAWLLSVWF
jgi:hypothetical protein